MGIYFDAIIQGNSFHIVESSVKPVICDSALQTLKKIELIVKRKLTYDSSHQDKHSTLAQYELFQVLKNKASQIRGGYDEKASKLNWLFRILFSREKEAGEIHRRIDGYIAPPRQLPILPRDLALKVFEYVTDSELSSLAQSHHRVRDLVRAHLVRTAQKNGYQGTGHLGATIYMQELIGRVSKQLQLVYNYESEYREVGPISHKPPEKWQWGRIDLRKTFENFKRLSTEDIFTIVSHQQFWNTYFFGYSKEAQEFFLAIGSMIYRNWKFAEGDRPVTREKVNKALFLAVRNRNMILTQFTLEHGADPNICYGSKDNGHYVYRNPFHWATIQGNVDLLKLLLQYKARVDERTFVDNETALVLACKGITYNWREHNYSPVPEVIKLLLEHGADRSILMDKAHQSDFVRTVSLLLGSNAPTGEED